jgi:hypothetical protein
MVFESHPWRGVLDATLCDNICQLLVEGQRFSPGTLISSNKKTDRHDITKKQYLLSNNTNDCGQMRKYKLKLCDI